MPATSQLVGAEAGALLKSHSEVEPSVVISRRWMCRVNCHRRKNWKRSFSKKAIDTNSLAFIEIIAVKPVKSLLRHNRTDAVTKTSILTSHKFLRASRNFLKLFHRSKSIGREVLWSTLAKRLLPHTSDANHEEFIQVGTEYCEKF